MFACLTLCRNTALFCAFFFLALKRSGGQNEKENIGFHLKAGQCNEQQDSTG